VGETSRQPDVLVIGAGVVGVSCAYYLARMGARVLVAEAGEVGGGCSGGNAGLLASSHCVPLAAPGAVAKALRWMFEPESPFHIRPRLDPALAAWLVRFWRASRRSAMERGLAVLSRWCVEGRRLYDELVADEGLECCFEARGTLKVFATEGGYREGLAEARLVGEHGIEWESLDAQAARRAEPTLGEGVVGAVFYPRDAHLDPGAFVRALADRAKRRGATIEAATEVIGFDLRARRIAVVRTTRGDFRPGWVVLAAGAWSLPLGRSLGLRLPLQPAKGYSVDLAGATPPRRPLLLGEAKVAVTPLGELVRLSGTLELAGMDMNFNSRRLEAVRRAPARYRAPGTEGEVVERWRGLRPCTPDGLPLVGRPRRFENLVVATGHAMKGMCLGPLTGKTVAALIRGQEPPLDPSPLSPDRFRP